MAVSKEIKKRKAASRDSEDAFDIGPGEDDSSTFYPAIKDLNQLQIDDVIEVSGAESDGQSVDDEEYIYNQVTEDANGGERYIYDEIIPDDNSEYSETDENANTIGNIPLTFYDAYPHIGYSINGKKIMRPAKGEALDALLDTIEVPAGWTGLTDPSTGKPIELSRDELALLSKLQMNEVTQEGYDPYQPTVEYFTSKEEIMPLSAAPEPKRRFVKSKHEAKRVMKLVLAIREGRILPYKPPAEEDDLGEGIQPYDLWNNGSLPEPHSIHMPPPKLLPPGYNESYHPPPEYLPDKDEEKALANQADEEDSDKILVPKDHDSLRKVPGYEKFIQEKFERCLDLYLAPRVRGNKLNIDPASLLPKLPNPAELKPFPTTCATLFRGHKGRVRSVSVDPTGLWLASGGDDGTVRVWDIFTGRQLWSVQLSKEDPVNVVRWRPGKEAVLLSAAAGENLYMMIPGILDPELESASLEAADAGWGYAAPTPSVQAKSDDQKTPKIAWTKPPASLAENGVQFLIPLGHNVKSISWHRRGDYFVTVCPSSSCPASVAIAIHTLSKHLTQHPFRRRMKGGGPPQTAHFHPSLPILYVANQRTIRSYDLARQSLLKILQPGTRWISSFDIHPSSSTATGDNLIVGSYDRRLLWHDVDLSNRPYKALRYHAKAIRAVKYHPHYPLFIDSSDDGLLQVFHGSIMKDSLSNANIVPLKVLRGHKVTGDLGVLDVDWHPREAWCISAGADGTCRLWM